MPLNVCLLGPPGSGKGTQSELFAETNGVVKLSTGDLLRREMQSKSSLGKAVKDSMNFGRLVPDEMINSVIRGQLRGKKVERGFVLDGYPRTILQAVNLDEIMSGWDPLIVVNLDVSEEQLLNRLSNRLVCGECGSIVLPLERSDQPDACAKCGGPVVRRRDDRREIVKERFKVYSKDTKPLLTYYHSRQTFFSINGDQTPLNVSRAIQTSVNSVAGVR